MDKDKLHIPEFCDSNVDYLRHVGVIKSISLGSIYTSTHESCPCRITNGAHASLCGENVYDVCAQHFF